MTSAEVKNSTLSEATPGCASEAEFAAVVFHNVSDCYAPEQDIECRYTIKPSVKPTKKDWVGLFKVGWQSSREHYTYEWSPFIEHNFVEGDENKSIANRVLFKANYLPKADEEFYQFCYVSATGEVRGASVPFQIKSKNDDGGYECFEMEDEEGMLLVKNRTMVLEDSLGRALEENACLKASKERLEGELEELKDNVMELETSKAAVTSKNSTLQAEKHFLAKGRDDATKRYNDEVLITNDLNDRVKDLEAKIASLEISKSDLMVILEHSKKQVEDLTMLLEKEKMQSSEVQKTREKLVNEKLQFLQNLASNRELADKLAADVGARETEINALECKLAEEKERHKKEIDAMNTQLCKCLESNKKLEEELEKQKDECVLAKAKVENMEEKIKSVEENCQAKEGESSRKEATLKERVEMLSAMMTSLEEDRALIKQEAASSVLHMETRLESMSESNRAKQNVIYELEEKIDNLKSQIENEQEKAKAMVEDSESVIRNLEGQLEGERALNKSLCSQSDQTLTELQNKMEEQLHINQQLSQEIEEKNTEIRQLQLEEENNLVQLQAAQVKISAYDSEMNALKSEKECLQQNFNESKGASLLSSKNSAASMYALQTAHTHLEKKYFQNKKELEELWRERNELKRTLATLQGNLSQGDLRHEIENVRAKNEDLRARLTMGAEAYKLKFIECRKLQLQMEKLVSEPSKIDENSQSLIVKLRDELNDEKANSIALKKSLEEERALMLKKCDEPQLQMEKLVSEPSKTDENAQSLIVKLRDELHEEKANSIALKRSLEEERALVLKKCDELEQLNVDVIVLNAKLESIADQEKELSSEQDEEHTMESLKEQIDALEQEVDVRGMRVNEMENLFHAEKADKQNLIEEIVNLQEQIKTCELEHDVQQREICSLQKELEKEQRERDALGDEAREKIAALEKTVQELKGEVERWKMEVDIHVAGETRMIGKKENIEVEPTVANPQQPPQPQGPRPPFVWPWMRNGGNWMGTGHAPPPAPYGPSQPWVMVQPQDVPYPPTAAPPTAAPQPHPSVPTGPQPVAPPQGAHQDRECPICRILFPPSTGIDEIQDHVNSHFDRRC